jgi:hypothetical protein
MGLRPTTSNERIKDGVILSAAKDLLFSCTLDNVGGAVPIVSPTHARASASPGGRHSDFRFDR